jgi:hypothetical protein
MYFFYDKWDLQIVVDSKVGDKLLSARIWIEVSEFKFFKFYSNLGIGHGRQVPDHFQCFIMFRRRYTFL